jgi:hypothetical protein
VKKLFRGRRRWCILGGLILTALIIFLFASWLSADNEGTVSQPTNQTAAEAYKNFDGQRLAFTYSGTYGVQTLPAKDNDLELYTFKASTIYDKHIAVSVSKLEGGKLSNNSAYNLRQSQPGTYTRRDVQVAGGTATVWVKSDNKEETVIIPHGNQVAVLSFVTAGNPAQLDKEVTALLQTLRWK